MPFRNTRILISKIYVYQSEKVNGKTTQKIDIYYNGVEIINIPLKVKEHIPIIVLVGSAPLGHPLIIFYFFII